VEGGVHSFFVFHLKYVSWLNFHFKINGGSGGGSREKDDGVVQLIFVRILVNFESSSVSEAVGYNATLVFNHVSTDGYSENWHWPGRLWGLLLIPWSSFTFRQGPVGDRKHPLPRRNSFYRRTRQDLEIFLSS